MKALFILLFCLGLNLLVMSQPKNCKSLHSGNFKVTTKEAGTTIVKRTKKLQIEENEEMGVKMTFDVTWINECTYQLRPKQLIKGDPSLFGKKGNVLTVRIQEIKVNAYTAEATSNFFDETMVFEIEFLD